MGKFGEIRSRKDIHGRYLSKGGDDISYPGEIGNVNSLSDFDSKKAGNFNSPAPPSPDNLRYSKNKEFLRSYFNDRQSYHFKNGLELAKRGGNENNISNIENLDEDPVIFGFDFIINQISSPLYVELPSFFDFAENISDEIKNRRLLYNDFIEHLELLFLSTRGGAFDSFKSHYLVGVDGLGDLINKSTGLGSNKQFVDFGKDKISLSMREDTHLSGGYLSALYNTLSYSKINGKQIIPDNLLRFDATIIISEIRNYKKISKMFNSGETNDIISVTSDNVSRYMYNLYDCQFILENHSHPSNVTNTSKDVTDEFKLDFFYKFSTMEMEKFKYSGDNKTSVRYTNDGNPVDPTREYIGESSDNINAVRRNNFINRGYQENINPYAKYDRVSNNNIQEDFSVISANTDELSTIKHNSMMESLKIQKENQSENAKRSLEKMGENSLIMGDDNSISGYLKGRSTQKFGEGGGLGGIISRTKDFAIDKVRKKRDKLINDTLQSIRNSTGLRRIGSPRNVYDDNLSIFGKLKNELTDFTNTGFTGLIGGIDDMV